MTGVMSSDFSGSRGDCTSPSNGTPDADGPEFTLSTDDEDPDYYVKQAHHAMNGADMGDASVLFGYGTDDMPRLNAHQTSPGSGKGQLRSPPSIDIASRRNRRPPPLSIDGSRSYSGNGIKTGIDFGRRGDMATCMRRVASATGPMRISKTMGVPRSPFQMSRSPIRVGPRGNAPPTPDTPILASQPNVSDASDIEVGASLSVTELAVRDPTFRTPPTTPGVMQNYLSLNSVYDMPMSDDGLVSPAVASYSRHFDMPNMPMSIPTYITDANGCTSQPQVPSFPSSLSAPCFGVSARNAEYTWPEGLEVSRNTSPVDNAQDAYFMNLGMQR